MIKWKPKFKTANVSPAVPKCQFPALAMPEHPWQKFFKGKWVYDQAELAHVVYLGRESQEKQTECHKLNYPESLAPRRKEGMLFLKAKASSTRWELRLTQVRPLLWLWSSKIPGLISEVALLSQPWNLTWHHLIIQVVVFLLMTNKPINYKTWLTANSIDIVKLVHVIEWNSSFTSSQSFILLIPSMSTGIVCSLETRGKVKSTQVCVSVGKFMWVDWTNNRDYKVKMGVILSRCHIFVKNLLEVSHCLREKDCKTCKLKAIL